MHNEKFNYIKFWCDLNVIIRIECIFVYFYRHVKAWTEAQFLYDALAHFIQNVLRSMLLHANKTTKNALNSYIFYFIQFIYWVLMFYQFLFCFNLNVN